MATEKTRIPKRFTIGIGGGHREYNMNGITYVVSGNFADPAKAKGAETLADKFEHIVSDEFVDLSVEDEPQNAKAARSNCRKGKMKGGQQKNIQNAK